VGPVATAISFSSLPQAVTGGLWTGTTSQGKPISFTTDGSGIRAASVGWSTIGCLIKDGETTKSYADNAPRIEGNSFNLADFANGGLVVIDGAFNTPTSAGGHIRVTLFSAGTPDESGAGCGGTAEISWTATPGGH
jgi:hypothetical protein